MEWIKGDKSEKIMFIIVNLALAAGCLRFLAHLVSQWNLMAVNIRDCAGAFVAFFSLLWVSLVRGKKKVFSLLMALMVLLTINELVRTIT